MRVAFDGRSLASPALRGWDRYTVGLTRALTARGVEATFLCRVGAPARAEHLAGIDCEVREVPARYGVLWEQVAVPALLRRERFDLHHAPNEHGVPIVAPCPQVLTHHSVTGPSYRALVRSGALPGPTERYVPVPGGRLKRGRDRAYLGAQVRAAAHIFAPSEFARGELIGLLKVPARKVTVTPLAPDDLFRGPPTPAAERAAILDRLGVRPPFLLFVGGYEPHKNVPGLLRTFQHVRRTRPDLRLVLVGSQPAPAAVRESAAELGVADAAAFLHGLTRELPALYDAAELLVSLSWRETFCLPAAEAMCRGTPAVASAWGATPEVIGAGGATVDPRDEAGAAARICDLLAGDRAPLRRAARARAAELTWEAAADRTLQVYRRLVG
ncbi:glycosyltransferase family 4 protein [Alienimonas sp. DA493]|uniref:glycosyltransferase family 4 protein n=1 Tax=Alienimonas sp. DA493 TaxID=3373605 RepID=UPI003754DAC4